MTIRSIAKLTKRYGVLLYKHAMYMCIPMLWWILSFCHYDQSPSQQINWTTRCINLINKKRTVLGLFIAFRIGYTIRSTELLHFYFDNFHQRMMINLVKKLIPPGHSGLQLGRRQFELHFLEWKWYHSYWNFTEICSQEPIDNKSVLVQVMVWRRSGLGATNAILG